MASGITCLHMITWLIRILYRRMLVPYEKKWIKYYTANYTRISLGQMLNQKKLLECPGFLALLLSEHESRLTKPRELTHCNRNFWTNSLLFILWAQCDYLFLSATGLKLFAINWKILSSQGLNQTVINTQTKSHDKRREFRVAFKFYKDISSCMWLNLVRIRCECMWYVDQS